MRSAPTGEYTQSPPVASSGTVTPLGTVSPAPKLRLATTGRSVEQFHAVRYPPAAGLVTVKFALSAVAPGGIAPVPVTWIRLLT
jgi:hypothetical protein